MEGVEKNLAQIENEIIQSSFEHEVIEFKKIDGKLINSFKILDRIDLENEPFLRSAREKLLIRIHKFESILKSKVECKNKDCIICISGIDLSK